MPRRRPTSIASRKLPKQDRSTELVAAILEAAVQVLAKEGAARFTTVRVAERAGVSVGSVYQYFPNKAAILFRLQSDEWRRTIDALRAILEDAARPPLERLRLYVATFLRSECDEAVIRSALTDTAPRYRDASEGRQRRAASDSTFRGFMREAVPNASDRTRALAGDVVKRTLSAVGKHFSERPRSPAEIQVYADAMADMFCAYLAALPTIFPT